MGVERPPDESDAAFRGPSRGQRVRRDAKRWYFTEMTEWSRHLHVTADTFVEKFNLEDVQELDDKLPN